MMVLCVISYGLTLKVNHTYAFLNFELLTKIFS